MLLNKALSLLNKAVHATCFCATTTNKHGMLLDLQHLHAAQSEAVELTHRLHALGQYISASPLHPVSTATCVRIREGKRLVTDGPFAETREFLGGYYMVQARDLNTVIPVAAQHPGARMGTVEVRRLYDLPNLL
jgi:hypothetical protein